MIYDRVSKSNYNNDLKSYVTFSDELQFQILSKVIKSRFQPMTHELLASNALTESYESIYEQKRTKMCFIFLMNSTLNNGMFHTSPIV